MKILIVEDDAINRKIMQHFAEPYGECDVAEDGQQAVQLFTAAYGTDNPYSLIFMDIMMPNMNGQEALRRIRQHEEAHDVYAPGPAAVKVIMTTSLDGLEDAEEAFSAMADGYLVKPVDPKKLKEQIEQLKALYGTLDIG